MVTCPQPCIYNLTPLAPFIKKQSRKCVRNRAPPEGLKHNTNNGQNTKIQQDNILLTQNEVRLL